jgi:hypothetical protein
MRTCRRLFVAAMLTLTLVAGSACGPSQGRTTPAAPSGAAPLAAGCPTGTPPSTFSDPFAYCACVGTVDAPDAKYTGQALPDSVIASLGKALNVPTDTPVMRNSVWRCMGGKVYGCTVGANLPCSEKANTNRTPEQALLDFCKENPSAEVIPAAVTGHNAVYEWRCSEGAPAIVKQVAKVDPRGFVADIWYELQPVVP